MFKRSRTLVKDALALSNYCRPFGGIYERGTAGVPWAPLLKVQCLDKKLSLKPRKYMYMVMLMASILFLKISLHLNIFVGFLI